MTPEQIKKLLPQLPGLAAQAGDVAQGNVAGGDIHRPLPAPLTLSDEEFSAVLQGTLPPTVNAPATPEIAAAFTAFAQADSLEETVLGTAAFEVELGGSDAGALAQRGGPLAPDDPLWGYVEAAALRYTYLLDMLTPVPPAPATGLLPRYKNLDHQARNAVFVALTARSELVTDVRGRARWLLRHDERRAALRRLIDRGALDEAIAQARADVAAEERAATRQAPLPEGDDAGANDAAGTREIEELLWSCLAGKVPPLTGQSRRELLLFQRVAGWLYGLDPGPDVPPPDVIARHLARETLLQPFRHLTGRWENGQFVSTFYGREGELQQLYDYLDVIPPSSLLNLLRRQFQAVLDISWQRMKGASGRPPLLIHGPGGVGKSSLLAKFLLDHLTESAAGEQIPYAYLDFDLSALSAREPVTMLAEAARQLGFQYLAVQQQWSTARQEWLETILRAGSVGLEPEARQKAVDRFARLLEQSIIASQARKSASRLPFLLVLDTFEELQYHDRDYVRDVFRFLNEFQRHLPMLRVVLMGRAPLDDVQHEYGVLESYAIEGDILGSGLETDFDVIQVKLGDLSPSAAREYLSRHGVGDPNLAEELIEAVGANPLSLRLITRVIQEGALDLGSLRAELSWRPSLGDRWRGRTVPPKALLQGVLFRRILDHIHDPTIRKLAHPGLVLRRITPELIKEVLAGPCDLGELDDAQARDYFSGLAREVSLVGTERDALDGMVLRHRPELRRIILGLMESDEAKLDQVRAIHAAAIRYYDAREGSQAREEALYHRLMLGDLPRPEALLDAVPAEVAVEAGYVPRPAAADDPRPLWSALADSVEELPAVATTYLAARVQRELVPDVAWEHADPRDWELMVLGRACRRVTGRGNLVSALTSLRRERDRMLKLGRRLSPLSPLPLVEVTILEQLGRYNEARELAQRSVSRLGFDTVEALRRRAEYNLLEARSAAQAGDESTSWRRLEDAKFAVGSLQPFGAPAVAVARRCERQLLAFAADCYALLPSARLLQLLASELLILAEADGQLEGRPALARYVMGCAVSGPLPLPSSQAGEKLLDPARAATLLPILLNRLPDAATTPVATILVELSIAVLKDARNERVPTILQRIKVPIAQEDEQALEASWLSLLQGKPDRLSAALRELFATVTAPSFRPRIPELYQALTPKGQAQAAEEQFEEARRAGDLLPGQGLAAARSVQMEG